jgi:hypothetical protein
MIEEKEQVNQQINRIDRLMKLIEMSMNLKNDTYVIFLIITSKSIVSFDSRQKIVDRMVEQLQNLELFYMNDTVEEQNRIIRQINDFMIVLSKALCEYIDIQSLTEIPIDFIQRLQFLSDLILKTVNTILTEATDEDVNLLNSYSIVNKFDYSGSSNISNSSS